MINISMENKMEKLKKSGKYMKRSGKRAGLTPLSGVLQAIVKWTVVYR